MVMGNVQQKFTDNILCFTAIVYETNFKKNLILIWLHDLDFFVFAIFTYIKLLIYILF